MKINEVIHEIGQSQQDVLKKQQRDCMSKEEFAQGVDNERTVETLPKQRG